MNSDITTAQEDLAYIRSIVDEVAPGYRNIGIVYMWAGILYGLQCLINFILLEGWLPASQTVWILLGILPTVIFLTINFTYARKEVSPPFGSGAAKKAINAAFAGAGVANFILAILFGIIAYQRNDWSTWFIFPVVVCAGQGAVWFTMTVIRRQLWIGLTSAGWFIATILLALCLSHTNLYILTLSVSLFICMALPGYILTRSIEPNSN